MSLLYFLLPWLLAQTNILGQPTPGNFRFANYYQSSMVLQRAPARATVWGYAGPLPVGATVTVNVAGSDYTTMVQSMAAGNIWEVQIAPVNAGGPYSVAATSGEYSATFNDVMFGDVWICSGQSNMEHAMWNIDNPNDDINDAVNYPNVRVMRVAKAESSTLLYDVTMDLPWQRPDTNGIGGFSAICWFYGRDLHRNLGIPIGLVGDHWSGSTIETWMSPDALAQCNTREGTRTRNGAKMWEPSWLYNAMIHPILPMTIYGAIWYQGEGNQGNTDEYACFFPAMIADWRTKFNARGGSATDFPFGFVQLAAFRDNLNQAGFPNVRWAQTAQVGYAPNDNMPRTFMAVAMDTPDFDSPHGSVHPRYKRRPADRLVYGGLNIAYGNTTVKHQGPFPTQFTVDPILSTVTIEYDNGQTPLRFGNSGLFEVCCAVDETYTCDEDGGTSWSPGVITDENANSGVTIEYMCGPPQVFVVGIRYAWFESPCNLYNCAVYSVENDLPAPQFVYNNL